MRKNVGIGWNKDHRQKGLKNNPLQVILEVENGTNIKH